MWFYFDDDDDDNARIVKKYDDNYSKPTIEGETIEDVSFSKYKNWFIVTQDYNTSGPVYSFCSKEELGEFIQKLSKIHDSLEDVVVAPTEEEVEEWLEEF